MTSGNAHSIHSPFVFTLYTTVLSVKKKYYLFDTIEKIRDNLKISEKSITITDFGSGGNKNSGNERKVRDIVKKSQKSPKLAQLLYRIVYHFKPRQIIETGTNLGITTMYLAGACPDGVVSSFEGCPNLIKQAQENFSIAQFSNIKIIQGNLDTTLSLFLKEFRGKLDVAYFDANHQYLPTIHYFNLCIQKAHDNTVFIFDDIHWSAEMEKAWKDIIQHAEVTLSIDLFFMGIVFFKKTQPKQHFKLRI